MHVVSQLSSQTGDRTEESNKRVAAQCLREPALLADVAGHLYSADSALAGDCAEVMTVVAQQQPQLVAPYATLLLPLLRHKKTRVRWEALHALALVAQRVPDVIGAVLSDLDRIIHEDPSIIVRDYAVDAVGNYAGTSAAAARAAYLLLQGALYVWNERHAGHALSGLSRVADAAAELRPMICGDAERFRDHAKGSVRKAARQLIKVCEA